jgi:hypothetical protein
MGVGLAIVGCDCVMRAARLSKLVAMSSCLAESSSCNGVGQVDKSMSNVDSIDCHLLGIGVACGSWVEELYVRIFRCSGDSACRSLRK